MNSAVTFGGKAPLAMSWAVIGGWSAVRMVIGTWRTPGAEVTCSKEATVATRSGRRLIDSSTSRRAGVRASYKPGDRVARGQPMGKAGSSGTGGGPHAHFQVMDRLSVLHANGLPYEFDALMLTGRTPPLAQVLPYFDTLEPIPISTAVTGERRNALPLGGDVVSFPAAP